jgi:hypothetical protein
MEIDHKIPTNSVWNIINISAITFMAKVPNFEVDTV